MSRLGIDVGGTFTDFALIGDGIRIHKQLTTPKDPSIAVLAGVTALGVKLSDVSEIVHGTTLVTNAVIERRGARTGLLVTAGFSDLPEIGLEQRYDLFDLRLRFAAPLIPRACRREIDERVHHDARVATAPDPVQIRRAIADLVATQQIEALAVCFLHSYANGAHEELVRAIAAESFPTLDVSTSADVFPYMREFERWTTTMANAYTQPIFRRYLRRLEDGLAAQGFSGRLYMMSSSGGIVTPETARRFPVRMLESGPAAGVLMSAAHGVRLGIGEVLAFDLGGTTAKGALIRDGRPLRNYEMEVARCDGHRRGSGLSLKLPVIDMTEIGAGGGSIAGVDERGLLRVGPHSAGAEPGPACYGRGGARATLTDANLMLGYLDGGFFLGGAMKLDAAAAQAAIARDVAVPLSLDRRRAAWGIHEVINEDIARAFRIHAVERGFDCRRATIVAFGGGGPIHATAVARKLRAKRVVFPVAAGRDVGARSAVESAFVRGGTLASCGPGEARRGCVRAHAGRAAAGGGGFLGAGRHCRGGHHGGAARRSALSRPGLRARDSFARCGPCDCARGTAWIIRRALSCRVQMLPNSTSRWRSCRGRWRRAGLRRCCPLQPSRRRRAVSRGAQRGA